ncbi:XdhC family protein [Flavobacterium sp. MAHUQ-51]|uniref:XdhC family protein n=1 Tax=Flavobacterium sp. GCM10022190 TaxID=3252639 RepID=UPI003608690E
MTHEFKLLVEVAYGNQHIKHVLATVVNLDGSSYRKPGVQMLISEDGAIAGAVSGGCVEKEVQFQALRVFETQVPKVITYDGSFRLGCKGTLYILIEPFSISDVTYKLIQKELKARKTLEITSFFEKEYTESGCFGSVLKISSNQELTFREKYIPNKNLSQFKQVLTAISQLVIFGAEHDAVALSNMAVQMGWEVRIVTSPRDSRGIEIFLGANQISYLDPEMPFDFIIDEQTAVVLMNHNYARDLHFLLNLQKQNAFYIGILGSAQRREKLMHDLIEYNSELVLNFMETIYSPAGINIGAITPQEIAISIISEILAIKNKKEVPSLRHLMGQIHNNK